MEQLSIYKVTTEFVVQCLNMAPGPCYPTLTIKVGWGVHDTDWSGGMSIKVTSI